MNDDKRQALLAKGRKLFDTCRADQDYACVLGYVRHNLGQGGMRAEVAREFISWLRALRDENGEERRHAAAILELLQPRPRTE